MLMADCGVDAKTVFRVYPLFFARSAEAIWDDSWLWTSLRLFEECAEARGFACISLPLGAISRAEFFCASSLVASTQLLSTSLSSCAGQRWFADGGSIIYSSLLL